MVITAYLAWHNCNNGWKAGGMPVLSILAIGHPVSSDGIRSCHNPIKRSQLSSAAHPHTNIL